MKYYKKILGKSCYLSPICLDDAELYAKWLNDPEVSKYLSLRSMNVSAESEKGFLEKLQREHNYAIVDLQKDELIGNCGFVEIDSLNRTGEVGIFIGNRDYWGKGYGTEALKLLIGYGINFLNLRSFFLQVYSYNARALRCYEKVGFKKIGARRNALIFNGREHDIILMDLLSGEFQEEL
jgi:RimJ/RimL family protein N-acetyltransferase